MNHRDIVWISIYHSLREEEQDSLAPFLFQVALLRATRNKEYNRLYQLLTIGDEFGLTNNAIARKAAELLERLQLFSDLLSVKKGNDKGVGKQSMTGPVPPMRDDG
jgi:hypothetical protein